MLGLLHDLCRLALPRDKMLSALKKLFGLGSSTVLVNKNGKRIEATAGNGSVSISVNGITYSRISDSKYTYSYWDYFLPLCYLYKRSRVLLIGLGGGTIVRQLNMEFGDSVAIDAVEIDKDMADIAMRFSTLHANVIIDDGAKYIKGLNNLYDIIILDAYENLSIPKQFMSPEFIEDAWHALRRNGILAINFTYNELENMESLKSQLRRFNAMEIDLGNPMNSIVILSKRMRANEIRSKLMKKLNGQAKHLLDGYMKMREL